tara:strand:- start:3492 stop:3701 length:210 start_codon:yes stop_codon:yes gene_type:complete
MSKKSIRFTIRQDGKVEEKVEGVRGDTCESLTRDLEKKLGDLENRIHTAEYYKQNEVSDVTLQHNQNQT